MQALKETERELSRFCKEAKEYKSRRGLLCFRQFGNLEHFYFEAKSLGIANKIKCKNAYNYEAKGKGFSLLYVEHDIILAFEIKTREQIDKFKSVDFLEFARCGNDFRITPTTLNHQLGVLFGCWLQDGKAWEVLGYARG